MPGALTGHLVVRQPLQFVMHQRHQLFERRRMALATSQQQFRNLLWRSHFFRWCRSAWHLSEIVEDVSGFQR